MKKLFYLIFLLLLAGCARTIGPNQPAADIELRVSAVSECTKTSISGNTLNWTSGDRLGLCIGDFQSNIMLENSNSSPNEFSGGCPRLGISPVTTNWCAYYPYSPNTSGTVVNASLPASQAAPFDKTANYMVTDVVLAQYDESNMPTVPLSFNTQLFAIVKITVINSSASYQDEKIKSIELISAEGKRMAGNFSFDVTNPVTTLEWGDAMPIMPKVSSDFSDETSLGLSENHTVFLFVRPDTYNGIQICIRTDEHFVTVNTSESISIERGKVTTLPSIDFATKGSLQNIKKIACWGDSFTHGIYAYPPILQSILGNNWCVYDGGESGHRTTEIAGRQGGIKLYTKGGFTFPSSGSTSIDGIYLENSELTVDPMPFRPERWSAGVRLLNPCLIDGTECTVTYSSVTRTAAGEKKSIAPNSEITTYGARFCRDADVTVIYMGANGGYNNDYNLLIKQHWAMIDFTTTKKYIVLGFHSRSGTEVEGGYLDMFNKAFGKEAASFCPDAYDGKNHVIDLRGAVVKRGAELLVKTGVYASKDELTESDKARLASGFWPYPFQTSKGDAHPNTAGETAISYLIHDKMVKLGYLTDSFILDDVTDL